MQQFCQLSCSSATRRGLFSLCVDLFSTSPHHKGPIEQRQTFCIMWLLNSTGKHYSDIFLLWEKWLPADTCSLPTDCRYLSLGQVQVLFINISFIALPWSLLKRRRKPITSHNIWWLMIPASSSPPQTTACPSSLYNLPQACKLQFGADIDPALKEHRSALRV